MSPSPWVTLTIVLLTFIGIAVGRYPIIKSNRTTIALMGVALLLAIGQVAFKDLPVYIDFDTIILLFSMMIINANLKLAGNLIVAETASHYRVNFWAYVKPGLVITLVTLLINTGWLYLIA
jgi:Na+/H+ antiporter NhaD/arsenite permease-like protein